MLRPMLPSFTQVATRPTGLRFVGYRDIGIPLAVMH